MTATAVRPAAALSPSAARPHQRLGVLDKARGLAIVLMFVDHVLVLVDPAHIGRLTVTRLSLPLFLLTAGFLYRGPRRRQLALIPAAIAATVLVGIGESATGDPWLGQPDVLWMIGWAFLLLGVVHWGRLPLGWVLVFAVLQPVTWVAGHDGYQLGTVVALLIAGQLLDVPALLRPADRLPSWVGLLGRYPLTAYVGHLLLISVALLVTAGNG